VNDVLITGVGVIANAGVTLDEFWTSLVEGRGRFTKPGFAAGLRMFVGAVSDPTLAEGLPLPSLDPADRSSIFALAASLRALTEAGLNWPLEGAERFAVVLGNSAGGQETIDSQYRRYFQEKKKAHPLTVARAMVSGSASLVSMAFGAKGPCFVTSSACASAAHAIGIAASMIRSGVVDAAIAGGTEACLTEGSLMAWDAMRIVSRTQCRPFAKGRDGLTISEGAGVLILESKDRVRSRGVKADIELAGFGSSADAADLFHPSAEGMGRAMNNALREAGLEIDDIDYVNAHGTGTRTNDETEAQAMKLVFGHNRLPPTSSTKGVTGHALGAAGAIEAVATVLAMRNQLAPPTANFDEPDPACDFDCIPNEARPMKIQAALSNSFAFGGLNATIAFRRISGSVVRQ
jgi:nodulation protein E